MESHRIILFLRLDTGGNISEPVAFVTRTKMKPRRPGVETEIDALKSYSVKRVELMMKENMLSFAVVLVNPTQEGQSNGLSPSAAQRHELVIGFIGITSPPSLFYIFDEKFWGNGYATEALRAFLQTYWERYPDGFIGGSDDVKGKYLEASVAHGNTGSESVVRKCGFVLVGEDTMHGNGRSAPTKVYRLLRPES